MSAWWLQQKDLTPRNLLLSICSHERRFVIIIGIDHTVQKLQGSVYYKRNQHKNQMTMISMKNLSKYYNHTQISISPLYT